MKSKLLVTLSTGDMKYLDQAKALFYSAAAQGWDGDFMLLAHNADSDDLQEFTKRGILVREENKIPIDDEEMDRNILSIKLNMFNGSMMKWENVIFIDSDCFVLRPLEIFTSYFSAVQGIVRRRLPERIAGQEHTQAFNAGVFAFKPQECLFPLYDFEKMWHDNKEHMIDKTDETLLNIAFPKWKPLPLLYNIPFFMFSQKARKGLRLRKFPPVNFNRVRILHCMGDHYPGSVLPYFWLNLLWGFNSISHISEAVPQEIMPCIEQPG